MKIRICIICCLILLALPVLAKKKIGNIFYAQNTLGTFNNAPKTALGKARLLKSIGYDGLEGFGDQNFLELKHALEQEGLQMPVNYVPLNFEVSGKPENPTIDEIKAIIKASAKGAVIYFHLHSKSFINNKENGDLVVTDILRELSDCAADFNVKLCAYPHISFYCETAAQSVKLAKLVNRRNYGAAMNLCHMLKVEGSAGIEGKIKEYVPWLFAVNICGADDGDTRQMDWDRLIQPLGHGSFDTYRFVKSLIDNGYSGPIGLQCYNLKGDVVETLTQSLQTWKEYKKRYSAEK
jgi:sugar phosphate isomerase/epimerase